MNTLNNYVFVTFIIISVVGFLFSFSYMLFYNAKLFIYIKKEKYDRWLDLSTIGDFGPGFSNPFKSLPYIYNELDTEDEYILRHKTKTKFGIRLCLIMIIALFGLLPIGGMALKFLISK